MGELDAAQTVAAAVQSRATTSRRLGEALERHPRLPRRAWLRDVVLELGASTAAWSTTPPSNVTVDLERDLDSAVSGHVTVRLGWGQVLDGACSTAAGLALLLQRGWTGQPIACSADCPVTAPGGRAG